MISNVLKTFTFARFGSLAAAIIMTASAALAQGSESVTQKPVDDKTAVSTVAVESKKDTAELAIKPDSTIGKGLDTIGENPFSTVKTERTEAPKKQTTGSGWQIATAPYLYITGLNGTVGARGRTIEIDLSFGDVMSSFKIGLMGAIEARKNKFVLVNDIIWLRLGEERTNAAGSAFSSSDIKVKMFNWDVKAGYRVAEGKAGALDILGGFRLMSLENELNTTTGILPGFNVSERKTWITPIGGLHGTVNVHEKVFLATLFDIGGGWGSDLTLQAYGGMGYRINPKVSIIGGWRYVKTDYNDNTGFVFDTTMNGLIVGARIQLR